jgi:hypothetical protein
MPADLIFVRVRGKGEEEEGEDEKEARVAAAWCRICSSACRR